MSGTKAFLPSMLRANKGCIVNVSSIFGIIAVPSQSAYNASKFAVRGFTEALQWELQARRDKGDCQVWAMCVMPGGVATNVARSARFYTAPDGNIDAAMSHAKFDSVAHTSPEAAAAQIIAALAAHQQRLLIGHDAKTLWCLQRVLPGSYWRVVESMQNAQKWTEIKAIQARAWWAWAMTSVGNISSAGAAGGAKAVAAKAAGATSSGKRAA